MHVITITNEVIPAIRKIIRERLQNYEFIIKYSSIYLNTDGWDFPNFIRNYVTVIYEAVLQISTESMLYKICNAIQSVEKV